MTALAAIYLAERIGDAVREVMFCEERYTGLRDGTLLWQQEYPEMFTASPDPQQEAAIQAATELDCARADLEALRAQANGGTGE